MKMGTIMFLTAVVFEAVFAAFCIITKSNQRRVRSIIRLAAFTVFVLLMVSQVMDRSFRHYVPGALLFLLAVSGAVSLNRKRQEKREYKAVRVVLKAVGMTVIILIFLLPAILFPQHKALKTTGEYQVAAVTYTYTDASRVETYAKTGQNRKLNVEFWYPQNAAGTYPLIVFSHGSFGIRSSNQSLYRELASHGYVVCSIDHTYQCFYTTDEDGHTTLMDMGYMKEISDENALADRQKSYEYYRKWMEIRTGDINFVIDNIISKTKGESADRVYKLIDRTRIGVMGHSLGGSAALGIGRMRDDVGAVIALESPFMCDIKGVKDGEFVFTDEKYPIPVLNVYSDKGISILEKWPQYAENKSLLSGNNAAAFNVHIRGVGHLNLTDLALTSPILTRMLNGQKSTTDSRYCLEVINKISLEFFDCYLKGQGKFNPQGTY